MSSEINIPHGHPEVPEYCRNLMRSESRDDISIAAFNFMHADSKFINDFVNAWTKVMELDRFDLAAQ